MRNTHALRLRQRQLQAEEANFAFPGLLGNNGSPARQVRINALRAEMSRSDMRKALCLSALVNVPQIIAIVAIFAWATYGQVGSFLSQPTRFHRSLRSFQITVSEGCDLRYLELWLCLHALRLTLMLVLQGVLYLSVGCCFGRLIGLLNAGRLAAFSKRAAAGEHLIAAAADAARDGSSSGAARNRFPNVD